MQPDMGMTMPIDTSSFCKDKQKGCEKTLMGDLFLTDLISSM
jgi:hypothetical protein